PELLFGACNYDAGVDVWAAGCVFAEMLLGRVWLPGMSDMGQLTLIYAALGAPSEDTWPGVSQLKTYVPGNVQ
ncbi:protein kinase domain-containing protein, partial [Haematococcus lacustris]